MLSNIPTHLSKVSIGEGAYDIRQTATTIVLLAALPRPIEERSLALMSVVSWERELIGTPKPVP